MKRWTYIAAIAALTIFAVVRVASTHRVFNATVDEPVHLAAGWIWWDGQYNIDLGHPPLARALCALPLRLAGLPDPPPGSDPERGNFLLYHGDRYLKNLARARMGNLVLFIAAILAVAALARRAFGDAISILAVALFTNLPTVLAHAALITTDMAVTAVLPLAILALDLFLESPSLKRAAVLGIAIGAGVIAKFSFIVYFPASALVLLAVRRKGIRWRLLPLVLLAAFLVAWAGYRFQFGRIADTFKGAQFFVEYAVPEAVRPPVRWIADHVPLPAPSLAIGIGVLRLHDKDGHFAFFLGETSLHGWWEYFPVLFFFKTPIPYLILALVGMALAFRNKRGIEHALIPLAILLIAMTGSINIGVRHVLPMYTSLSIVAAYATAELWRRASGRAFAMLGFSALMVWLFAGAAVSHPDYLAYFNEAARGKPWNIAVDSNLDWGQDVVRLEKTMRELNIEKVWIRYSTGADLQRHVRFENLPDQPVTGWIAIGETPFALFRDRMTWLDRYEPVRRVGHSMRLYYVPPPIVTVEPRDVPLRNTTRTSPATNVIPSVSATGASIRWPSTNVPFLLDRSRNIALSPWMVIEAWRRETVL